MAVKKGDIHCLKLVAKSNIGGFYLALFSLNMIFLCMSLLDMDIYRLGRVGGNTPEYYGEETKYLNMAAG